VGGGYLFDLLISVFGGMLVAGVLFRGREFVERHVCLIYLYVGWHDTKGLHHGLSDLLAHCIII